MIETIQVNSRLSNEERETIIGYDNIDKVWTMDSTIVKHFNKALKQGWTPKVRYVYDDGTVCGMVLVAPEHAITIRNPNKKRVMNDEQMKNLHRRDEEDDTDED